MAVKETIPSVETKIQSETLNVEVTGDLNIVIPVNSPSGPSEPTRYTSIAALYKGHGVSTAPSASDDESMLQAAAMLQTTPVYVVRTHQNRVFEGVTDTGEKIYFDSENNILKHRYNINLSFGEESFADMYIVFDDVCVYSGTKPSGVAPESTFVEIMLKEMSFESFIDAMTKSQNVASAVGLFFYNDGALWTEKRIIATSFNIADYKSIKVGSIAMVDIAPTAPFKQTNYLMINDEVFFNNGTSINSIAYPGNKKPLQFQKPGDSIAGGTFALYLYDKLMQTNKRWIVINGINLHRTYVPLNPSSLVYSEITTNIDGLEWSNGVLTMIPNPSVGGTYHIKAKLGDNYLYFTNDSNYKAGENETKIYVDCYTPYRLIEALEEANAMNMTNDDSKYRFGFNTAKVINYGYNFPDEAHLNIEPYYQTMFGSNETNMNMMKVESGEVVIDDTAYYVGENYKPTLANATKLSSSPITLETMAQMVSSALPTTLFGTYEGASIVCFSLADSELNVNSKNIVAQLVDENYVGVEDGNIFAVKLKYNSRSKIAQFSYTYDKDSQLFSFTGSANGDSYTRNVQFIDSTLVDGFGSPTYYQSFNEAFKPLELILLNADVQPTTPEFNSPMFGSSVPVPQPSSTDMQEALKRLDLLEFTKFELMLDGGFINPAFLNVMEGVCSKHKIMLFTGTPNYKKPDDLVTWRASCPANTWSMFMLTPRLKDSSLGNFSVWMSPAVQKAKSVVQNRLLSNEFNPGFGATEGLVSGTPEFNFIGGTDEDSEQNQLIGAQINCVCRSDELDITYINDNLTMYTTQSKMQEENIVRMMNAAAHVGEIWLKLNAIAKFNTLKLRQSVVSGLADTIKARLQSQEKPYSSLEIICDATNGNVDGSTTLYVTGYLTPYGSVHHVKFLEVCKNLDSN